MDRDAARSSRRSWLEITASDFRRCGADAVLALRLGAFSNAIQAQLPSPADSSRPWQNRDQMYRLLVSIGYLKEAIDLIQQNQARIRILMNGARKAKYLLPKWSVISPLLTQGPNTLHDRAIKALRHNVGFHFDAAVFSTWLKNRNPNELLTIWQVWGSTSRGRTYRASADAMVASMASDVGDLKRLLKDVANAQTALLSIVEGVLLGSLLAADIDAKKLLRQEATEGQGG